jgi:hypothetical protein
MANSDREYKTSKRLMIFILAPIAIFFTGYAASAATIQKDELKVCVSNKTGAIRQATKCSNGENPISLQTAGSGELEVVEKHLIPENFGKSGTQEISFPDCPASAPIFLGNHAYIPKTSSYALSNLVNQAGQNIYLSPTGPSAGTIFYSNSNSWSNGQQNRSKLVFGSSSYPAAGELVVYAVASCASFQNAKTIRH